MTLRHALLAVACHVMLNVPFTDRFPTNMAGNSRRLDAGVFVHVTLKRPGLCESLVTQLALVRLFAAVHPEVAL